MRKIQTLQRLERWLKYRLYPHALILMYHRIIDVPSDPKLMTVKPEHFAEHLEIIRHYGSPMGLQQLVDTLRAGQVPERAVVITFDDGYADNFTYAKPILERYDMPATFFVTAGYAGTERLFWWDGLERVLLQPGEVSGSLRLCIEGHEFTWDLGTNRTYPEEDFESYRGWHVERPDTPSERHQLYRALYDWFYHLPDAHRAHALDELFAWGDVADRASDSQRALTMGELVALSAGEQVEIGAHTMTHPVLSHLSAAEQRDEILQGKERLEVMIKRQVKSFAIPHGESNHATAAILREAGFRAVCSSIPDAVWPGADGMCLARVVARDSDGMAFSGWLRRWLDG